MLSSLDRPRRITLFLAFASAAGLGACASATGGARGGEVIRLSDRGRISETLDSLHVAEVEQRLAQEGREGGPRIRVRTDDEFGGLDRVTASFKLDDDAYVAVFNVDTDGRVRTLFPESPDDMGYLKGGYTYRLTPFFPGFGSRTYSAAYRPSYGDFGHWTSFYGSSAYGLGGSTGRYGRQGGYVFVVASWSPLRLDELEGEDLWDSYLVGDRLGDLLPYRVMHAYAERLVPRGRKWYTVDYRYYGDSRAGGTYASRYCNDMDYLAQLGYLRFALLSGRVGYGQLASLYNTLSLGGCRDNVTMMYRALIAAMLTQQRGFTRPGGGVIPTPPPPTPGAGGDTLRGGVSQPAPTDHPKRGGTRRADGDDGPAAPLNRPPKRGEVATGDEPVIDLGASRPSRAQRDRIQRDWARDRAGSGTGAWSGSGGSRVYRGRGAGEADRTTRTPEPRSATPRSSEPRSSEPRSSEPRSATPRTERPRPEPRSEPRSEQPRYDPPPRASAPAPAPAPAPRGESGGGGGKPREP